MKNTLLILGTLLIATPFVLLTIRQFLHCMRLESEYKKVNHENN